MAMFVRILRSLEVRCTRTRNRLRSAYWRSILGRGMGQVGRGFLIRAGATIDAAPGSRVLLGADVTIAEGASLYVGPRGTLEIGDGVFIGKHSVLVANQELRIGAGTQVAHGVTVIDTDHGFGSPEAPLVSQGERSAPIRIGREVWIGAHAIVLKGKTIGDRAVVGAGSVVTKDVAPGKVSAGNPARELR